MTFDPPSIDMAEPAPTPGPPAEPDPAHEPDPDQGAEPPLVDAPAWARLLLVLAPFLIGGLVILLLRMLGS